MHADFVRHLGMKSRDINEKLHNKINNTVPCEDFEITQNLHRVF